MIVMLYSSFPDKEAATNAARALLERRLVACVNIIDGATSLYHWQGALQQEQEAILLAKTRQESAQPAIEALKAMHPYELPCIMAYSAESGFPPFMQWVEEETR